jgi:glycosyltransferase involved in cell wall biosynthesis
VTSLLLEGAVTAPELEPEVLLLNDGRLAEWARSREVALHILPETQFTFLKLLFHLRRFLRNNSFDVIHAHRYKELVLAALARWPRRCGLVATIHGLEPWSQLEPRARLRVWSSIVIARLAGARFAAVSEELAARLRRRLGSTRVVRIPNPMPEPSTPAREDIRERFGWEPTIPLVGFVGRLEHVKGPDRFVELARRVTGARFVAIGGGSQQVQLEQRARRPELCGRVVFLGEVGDAPSYFSQLDILAVPSRHEGMPMVLLEAAAAELPVIAFDVGGVGEVLDGGPAGRLVPAADLEAFVQALEEQLATGRRIHASASAVAHSRRVLALFGRETVTAAYLELYRRIASPPAEGPSST